MTLPLPPVAVEEPASGGLDRLLPGSAVALLALNAVLWWQGWNAAPDLNMTALAVAGLSLLACLGAFWLRRTERLAQRSAALQAAERQHNEQTRNDERWTMAFDGASEALILCDAAGTAVQCNAAAVALLGVPAGSIVGQPIVAWLQIELPRAGGGTVGARLQRLEGDPIPVAVEVSQAVDHSRAERLLRLRDLTDQRDVTQRLASLANFDSLTGLPNRELFRDRLGTAMARARRTGQPMALMFLDLDRFKVVNDSLGHAVGDDLLRHVSHTLSNCLRSVDVVARCHEDPVTISRLGGDEFTVIVEAIGGADDAAMIARRMLEALSAPFVTGEEELVVSASIGISMYPTDDVDLDGLLRHTDMAMYRSKSMGRNTFSFFSDDLNTAVKARMSLEGSLRRAIERDEFILYYQPKADLHTGKVVGVEALLRWDCPGKGMVPPDRFIAVLEDTGLILPVGAWVIRKALAELEQWDKLGLPPITMAVNLSARQLRHQYLTSLIEDSLLERRISPQRLELELTESLLMEDTEMNRLMLSNFARIGVRLAIDDFGTGHSSLSYLRRFRVDTLKIDRSFVGEIPHDSEDCAIATAIIALGRSMQIKLVAEGVETAEQAAFLRELGCDEMQGYLLTRPLPMPQFIEWFNEHERKLAHNELPMYAVEPDTIRGALLTMDGEPVTV